VEVKIVGNKKFYRFNDQNLIPNRLIWGGKYHKITKLPEKFIIKDFEVVSENDFLKDIVIYNSFHPNAITDSYKINPLPKNFLNKKPPERQIYCLQSDFRKLYISEESIEFGISFYQTQLKTYNYENCYWMEWEGLEHKRT